VIVGYWQTQRLRETIEQMKVSEQRQSRAYVGVVDSSVANFLEGQTPSVFIALRNNGQTPAYDFYATVTVAIGPYPLPSKDLPMPNPLVNLVDGKVKISPIGVGIMTPSHTTHLSQALGIEVSPEAMAEIKAGKRALYAWGFAKYRDAFNRHWHLEYRYFSGGPGSTERLYDDRTTEKQIDEREHSTLLSLAGTEAEFLSDTRSGSGNRTAT
jgi:hypothetical protein